MSLDDDTAISTTEIDFLGFKIKDNCRLPSEEKTKVMREFPTPTSKKAVQEFVGLTNYFRGLIPDYAKYAAPLYEVMGKKAKFEWTEERDNAFKVLREKMSSEPVVRLPDLNVPFIVKTDACDTGMGAVLLQEIDGQRHVIEFASKQFNETQLRYPIIEKEATAIMFALNKWEHYLLGTKFKIGRWSN